MRRARSICRDMGGDMGPPIALTSTPLRLARLLAPLLVLRAAVPQTAPRRHKLRFRGDADPGVIHRYEVHVDLNRANYGDAGPPTLALRASALLGSELLAIVHPPSERSARTPLGPIAPECDEDGGGDGGGGHRRTCQLGYYRVRDDLGFSFLLEMAEFPLPGVNADDLEPDESGYLPPTKGATVVVEVEVVDGGAKGRASLEEFVDVISDMLGVKDPETSISEVAAGTPMMDGNVADKYPKGKGEKGEL